MAAIPASIGVSILRKIAAKAASAPGGYQAAGNVSKELLGYDFIGLVTKLVIFYTIAYAFAKFMEAVIYGTNFLTSFIFGAASLFGVKILRKETLPPMLVKLFGDGYGEFQIKYWDIVKALSLALVVFEGLQYYNANKAIGGSVSPFTLGIFGMIISAITLVTVPELMHRRKDSIHIAFSKDFGRVGDNIGMSVDGLLPSTPFIYGWKELNITIPQMSNQLGEWTQGFDIAVTTPPGRYTIYIDQREAGGPFYQESFDVVEGIAV